MKKVSIYYSATSFQTNAKIDYACTCFMQSTGFQNKTKFHHKVKGFIFIY